MDDLNGLNDEEDNLQPGANFSVVAVEETKAEAPPQRNQDPKVIQSEKSQEYHQYPPYYISYEENKGRLKRGQWLWTNLLVPYLFDISVKSNNKNSIKENILSAFKLFIVTPIRFIECFDESPRYQVLRISIQDQASSYFGCFDPYNGPQELKISKNDTSVRAIAQLLMNALGITTKESPIKNYRPCPDFYFVKDANSIMNSSGEKNRPVLSPGDLNALNFLYNKPKCTRYYFGDLPFKQYSFRHRNIREGRIERMVCIYCNFHCGSHDEIQNADLQEDFVCNCKCNDPAPFYFPEAFSTLKGIKRKFTLKKTDWCFEKVQHKSDRHFKVVYEVQRKKTKPDPIKNPLELCMLDNKKEEKIEHSSVIRLSRFANNEAKMYSFFKEFDIRKSIDYSRCPYLIRFYEDGMFFFTGQLIYAVRYDDPGRSFDSWLTNDHAGLDVDVLDIYRLARSSLEVFNFLQKNDYILERYTRGNIYVGNMLEDRGCFFKIMFKGSKNSQEYDKTLEDTESDFFEDQLYNKNNVYDYYIFKLGFYICYFAHFTSLKPNQNITKVLPENPYSAASNKLNDMIVSTMKILENIEPNVKQLKLQEFLEATLLSEKGKRPTPEKLLGHDFIVIGDKLDYEEYLREQKELEYGKERDLDEDKKVREEFAALK